MILKVFHSKEFSPQFIKIVADENDNDPQSTTMKRESKS